MNRRIFVKSLALTASALGAGCFGSFKATTWLYGVNKGISGNKFVQWLVFLGLILLPVYEIAGLIDIFILNSIEFWFGGGVAQNESDERIVELEDGRTLTLQKDLELGTLTMRVDGGERDIHLVFQMGERSAVVRSGHGLVASGVVADNGAVDISSGGQLVQRFEAESADALLQAYSADGQQGAVAWARQAQISGGSGVARR